MNAATRAIALADDVTVVRALEFFHSELSESLPLSIDELLAAVDKATRSREVGHLLDHFREDAEKELESPDAVALARWLLVSASEFAPTEQFVLRCLRDWPDDRQTVGKTIAVGTVGLLWLVLAATEVSYKNGSLEIHKKAVVPQEIEASVAALKAKLGIQVFDPDRTAAPVPAPAPAATAKTVHPTSSTSKKKKTSESDSHKSDCK